MYVRICLHHSITQIRDMNSKRFALHVAKFYLARSSRRSLKTDGFQWICKNWIQGFNFLYTFSHYVFCSHFFVGAYVLEIL